MVSPQTKQNPLSNTKKVSNSSTSWRKSLAKRFSKTLCIISLASSSKSLLPPKISLPLLNLLSSPMSKTKLSKRKSCLSWIGITGSMLQVSSLWSSISPQLNLISLLSSQKIIRLVREEGHLKAFSHLFSLEKSQN